MADDKPIRVTVEIRLDMMSSAAGFGNLAIREDFSIPVAGFTELAGILGRFHALAQAVKDDNVTDTDCSYYRAHGAHHGACCPIGRKAART